ncbi:MAG: tetratricopeptide repeat protein [Myxococcales bacterium FL481]|nr:MAG: tetratricopeptide repeat protein [Myxococcales bacterium FL481]
MPRRHRGNVARLGWLAAAVWGLSQAVGGAEPPAADGGTGDRDSPPQADGARELPGVELDTATGDEADDSTAGETGSATISEEQRRALEFEGHLARARRAQRERRWREAERAYQAALDLQPMDAEALRGRAHARHGKAKRGTCPRAAVEDLWLLQVYDPRGLWLSERANVLAWSEACGDEYATERLRLAEELGALPAGQRGRPKTVAALAAELRFAQARSAKSPEQRQVHLQKARSNIEAYLTECSEAKREVSIERLHLAAEIFRGAGALARAQSIYEQLIARTPGDARAVKALAELQIQLRVRELEATQAGRPTPEAEAAYNRAVEALAQGRLEQARSDLGLAINASPWFPQAYYRSGQVHARSGEFTEAIEAFTTAIEMNPYDYAAYMGLGLLYYKRFRGTQDSLAVEHLSAALRLRPDLHDLHYYLGDLYARVGQREAAREHFQAFIDQSPLDDPQLRAARDALRDLERDPATAVPSLPPPPPAELRRLPPALQQLINEAYVAAEFGDLERAREVLERAREQYSNEPAVFNALADVDYAQGRYEDANRNWAQSLGLDGDQMVVHERLGLADGESDRAEAHLERAAELGSATARFNLAVRRWDRFDIFAASRELDAYLRQAGPYDLNWDRAQRFRERIDEVLFRLYTVSGSLLALGLGLVLWRVYRRMRGASLAQFLRDEPKSFPDVARILSLIRHEILKHNTAFLGDVAHALEVEASDADARAVMLARRLFGDDDDPRSGGRRGGRGAAPRGIYGRFLGYVAELEKVGRSHGVNLNLYRKDPTFRSMIRAFDSVAGRVDALRSSFDLKPSERLELAKLLDRAGDVLGRRAFEQLTGTIMSLCVVDVTPRLFVQVLRQVAAEEQFQALEIAPLRVRGKGASIRVFQTDLEDILANVLRNSLHSAALYAPPPIAIAVDLVNEVDDITGHTTLAIRIKDQSSEQLTNEMLRGRYVERGMGITADLLSRYDASIAVEPEPHWAKAVVLRFFVVEATTGAAA